MLNAVESSQGDVGASDTAPVVEARHLFRKHSGPWVVKDVSLSVPLGGRHALIGPNGAGKTTLMRMISATLPPQSGSLSVCGHDVLTAPRVVKSLIGVVPQGMTCDNEISVRENLVVFGRYHRMPARQAAERADELLETMKLTTKSRAMPLTLSGGMQRRLLIARALMNRPRLLLLDEPTTGLDPESRHLLWDTLNERCADGMSLLLTTHYLEEVTHLCDGLTLLRDGQVEWTGSPRALMDRVPPYVVVNEEPGTARVELPTWDDDGSTLRVGRRALVFGSSPADLNGRHGVTTAVVRPSGLEDALDAFRADRSRPTTTAVDAASPALAEPRPPLAGQPVRRLPQPPVLGSARQIWWRNLVLFRKSYRTTIVPNFFEPVFMLLALGVGLGGYVSQAAIGSSYLMFVAPGLLAVTAMNGAVFEVTYNVYVRLRQARSYDATITSPVEPTDIALGEILWALTRCTVYSGVFLAILALMGHVHSMTAVLVVPALVPLGAVFACIGLLFTSRVRAINAYSYFYTLALTPLTLTSGVFFPVDRLPGVLRLIAHLSPLQHGIALSRSLIVRGEIAAALPHFAYLVCLAAVLLPLGVHSLRRCLLD